MRRTKRGRFTSRRRAGKYHTRLVGRITGEARRRRRHRRRGLMENPANGWDILIGLATGAIGFAASDVIDRLIVTRERKDDKGNVMAVRFPEAPLMDDFLPRVGAGVLIAAVPLGAAQLIRSDMGRSALQFFGFGAAFRLIGKAVDDLAAYLFKDSAADSTGKKLFAGEIGQRAAVGLTGLPVGVGACPTCGQTNGLGACCRNMIPSGPATGPMVNIPQLAPPPSSFQQPNPPPVVTQGPAPQIPPPVVARQPQTPAIPVPQIPPPAITVPRVPGTQLPATPAVPPAAMYAPVSPLPAATVGVNGGLGGDVGSAMQVLRTHGDAYQALRRNRTLLDAYSRGVATQAQRETVEGIVSRHSAGLAALQAFHPNTLDQAARGLGMVLDDAAPAPGFRGARRHRERDAAE